VHRAQQRVVGGDRARLRLGEPRIDGDQVATDFGAQDLEQHGVDRRGDGGFVAVVGDGRRLRRPSSTSGVAATDARPRPAAAATYIASSPAATRSAIASMPARSADNARFAAQRGVQLRQRVERLVDQRDDRRARRTRAVEHAVEHVLDLPAELAERLGADEAAAALQRVEDAADRTQFLASSGALRHGGSIWSRWPISSSNSSRKTSRISSSISSPVASKPPAAPVATGAKGRDNRGNGRRPGSTAATGSVASARLRLAMLPAFPRFGRTTPRADDRRGRFDRRGLRRPAASGQ
jgi:hypothetical protein